MVEQTRKLRAIWLSALLVFSLLAFGVGTVPGGAVSGNAASNAAGNADLTTAQSAAGEYADYSVRADFDPLSKRAQTLRVNFTGTGADLQNARVSGVTVTVGGTKQDVGVSSTTAVKSGEALDVTLASDIPDGSPVTVTFDVRSVQNPALADDHNVTIDARTNGQNVQRANDEVTIVEGGDITGTVTNESGSALTDNSVDVRIVQPNTGTVVTSYGVNPNNGVYRATVPAGTYYVNVTADGYARQSSTVSVTTGGSVTNDVTMEYGGWVNGTVTNGTGAPLDGVQIQALRAGSNDLAATTTTASDGSYSLALDPATSSYVILASPGTGDDYDVDFREGVTVTDGATTTVNMTTPRIPGDGTLSVSVTGPNGKDIDGATVSYRSSDYRFGGRTTTDSTGQAAITTPAETYLVRIEAPGYGPKVVRGVTVNESETANVAVSLSSPATIEGSVTDVDGSGASRVQVLVSDGENFYPATTDSSGDYSVTVSSGNYTVSVFARDKSASSKSVTLRSGETERADFSLEKASVKASNVTITSGPGDRSNLGVRTDLQSGLLQLQLVDESSYKGSGVGKPDNLTSLGVTESTEFRIDLTVKNFDPNSLIWGLRNASWETSPNASVKDGTDITITGSTVDLQAVAIDKHGVGPLLFQSPSQVSWPTGRNAAADVGFTRTVYFGLFDLSTVPGPVQNNLNGISTTTNAQRFAPPTYDNGSLQVWMAAPSKNTSGGKHTGFYQATIPDAQLNEWGVDDPETELDVSFKNEPRKFTVTEIDDGARILIENISYSAGYAEISPNETAISSNSGGSDNGGSSGTTAPTVSDTESEETTNTTANTTTTPSVVEVSAVQNASTGIATATVATVQANETVSVQFDGTDDTTATDGARITRVNVTAAHSVEDLDVSVGPSSESPSDVPALSTERTAAAVEYVTIDTSITDGNVSEAAIHVTLTESERESLGVSRANVTVYRYHDGWQALNTTSLGDGEYRAESPGFSTFAVGGPQRSVERTETATTTETHTETATPTAERATVESTSSPTPTVSGSSGPGFGVVVALLAVFGVALLARTRRA
ncbi:carboxypeptidase regulatory-like domain-containing protein [Haloarcula sp. JP-L23]|uniref:carboxypeptidase regulatory-like domain-containing protein n=1 Tax=Haloarcula sp. JP-L23 TaxID=2716717 RepID=UPI00140F0A95|nr:PGF-pre-PGF domain-containing protein [Haloarcula sp. JP-L23]